MCNDINSNEREIMKERNDNDNNEIEIWNVLMCKCMKVMSMKWQ